MTVVAPERLADVFVELADTLVDDFDVIEFLMMVTHRTAELIGEADVGLLLADQRGQLRFMAGSNEDIKRLELFQLQVHEGPCLDAFRSGKPVVNAELPEAEDRWPTFAPHAAAAGYHSVHAFPLKLRQEVIGAIGIFGTDVTRWDAADIHIAQSLAHVATIGLLQERAVLRGEVLSEQLQSALNSRIVIEQAKGAIAQFRSVSVEEAFVILRALARQTNTHLVEVAHAALADPASMPELSSMEAPAHEGELPAHVRGEGEQLSTLLDRADQRDSAAEHRDRNAEARDDTEQASSAWKDRDSAGRDRDDSAGDRADLIDLLQHRDRPDIEEP